MGGRVFVHHDGALGDTLLSLPALTLIREEFGRLHLAAGSDVAKLLLSFGFVDEVSSTGSGLLVPLYEGKPDDRLARFFEGFDAAYVFSVRGDSAAVKAIKEVVRDTTAILTMPPEGARRHVSEFRMQQLPRVTTGAVQTSSQRSWGSQRPLLRVPRSFRDEVRGLVFRGMPERLLVIHPGSGGRRKCWPLTRYFELAERLRDLTDCGIILLSGPSEEEARPLLDVFAAGTRNVMHMTGLELTGVAALLSLSACYIGNDSGISHLAGAVGAPAVVIFGPTDQALWRPRGRVGVVAPDVDCAPCGDSRSRVCRERLCLDAISVDMVQEAVETFLRGDAGPR